MTDQSVVNHVLGVVSDIKRDASGLYGAARTCTFGLSEAEHSHFLDLGMKIEPK